MFHFPSAGQDLVPPASQCVRWSDVLERLVVSAIVVKVDELTDHNLQFSRHFVKQLVYVSLQRLDLPPIALLR